MLSGKGLGATGVGGAQNHGCRRGTKPRVPTWVCDRVAAWVGCQSRVRAGRLVVVRFVEGLEERVGHALCRQVCAWAVAWEYFHRSVTFCTQTGTCLRTRVHVRVRRGTRHRGVVQRKEVGQDAADEGVIVAAGVVGAADGAGEERVAAEEDALGALEEAQTAAGMSRRLYDLEPEVAHLDGVIAGHRVEPAVESRL